MYSCLAKIYSYHTLLHRSSFDLFQGLSLRKYTINSINDRSDTNIYFLLITSKNNLKKLQNYKNFKNIPLAAYEIITFENLENFLLILKSVQ